MLFLLSAVLVGLATAAPPLFGPSANAVSSNLKTCPFPNGTDKAIHSYMCSNNEQFRIDNITVTDLNNKPIYPIDPSKSFILDLISYNNGPQINDNKVNVKIYEYTTGWLGSTCHWSEIDTFGLLNGIDGCKFAHNCPLTHGPLVLQLQMDLHEYSAIINFLAAYRPYQLEIRLYNYNEGSSHEEIACVMAQVELS